MTALSRPLHGWMLAITLVAGLLLSVGTASASCLVARESVELVTGRLAGQSVQERVHVNLGQVLGVVELESVRVWEALPEHTAASAVIVSRYWGVLPPDDRLGKDHRFDARIDGGHYAFPETTTSCDPSVAQPLGSQEYVAVFEVSDFVVLEGDITPQDEAILTQFLGEPIAVDPPVLPFEHPNAGDQSPDTSRGPAALIIGSLIVAIAAGLIWWRVRRAHSDATRTRA